MNHLDLCPGDVVFVTDTTFIVLSVRRETEHVTHVVWYSRFGLTTECAYMMGHDCPAKIGTA